MNYIDENAIYGFVSGNMSLWFESTEKDCTDLNLLLADIKTISILQSKGFGCSKTAFGISLNQSKALMLGSRFAYCISCGRFTSEVLNAAKSEFLETGKSICNEWFEKSVSEAFRFARTEPEFMALQRSW